ncbi:MAG: baseplate J/gp47 family protein, partial [Eubacterium sp.]|nr:baseplate J/gp47 family protein [Eubacterium sp.]
YHLLEHDGRIVIEDAGEFIGAELYIGSIAVTEGPKGNVRAENYFLAPELSPEPIFYNPGPGTGGVFRESLEDVRNRFREDVYTPYTCITAEDYERAAASAPGLCIRKIRAVMDELENIVHISVLPGTDEQFPKLSRQYIDTISATLSERRLITTRFQILPPVYVAVSVKLTVYVKRQFRDSRNQIEERVKKLINYIDGDKNFGDPLTFEEVFAGIENLDCVDYVYDLFMQPQNLKHAKLRDSNIYPSENCLLYPGQIMLETLITSVAVK